MEPALDHVFGSPGLAAAIFAIVLLGSVLQFSAGMGFGLTVAPVLAILDPALVPASTLFLGLLTATWGATRERGAIRWGEVGTATLGRLAGVVLAVAVLSRITTSDAFSLVFGLFVALAVVLSLIGWRLPVTAPNLFAMGTVSGLMGTITSVGAPPMALVYQSRPAGEARPTLASFFAVGCALSLAGLYVGGKAGLPDLLLALFMLPGVLAGAAVSRLAGRTLDARYRWVLLSLSGAAAVVLILRGST